MRRRPSRPRHRPTAHDDDSAPPAHIDTAHRSRIRGRPDDIPARAATNRARVRPRGDASSHDIRTHAEHHAPQRFTIDRRERQPHADILRDDIGHAVVFRHLDPKRRHLSDALIHAVTVVGIIDAVQFDLTILT